jgi:hypothetical protein
MSSPPPTSIRAASFCSPRLLPQPASKRTGHTRQVQRHRLMGREYRNHTRAPGCLSKPCDSAHGRTEGWGSSSELLVSPVAVRSVCGALALAQPRFFRRLCGERKRRECRSLVGSVAHRLRFRFPASAPMVCLAGFELHGHGLTSCDLGVCHGLASGVGEWYARRRSFTIGSGTGVCGPPGT